MTRVRTTLPRCMLRENIKAHRKQIKSRVLLSGPFPRVGPHLATNDGVALSLHGAADCCCGISID
jgi:hypothetical protein